MHPKRLKSFKCKKTSISSEKAAAKAELVKVIRIKISFKAIMVPRLYQNSPTMPHLSMVHLRMAVIRPIFDLIKIRQDPSKTLICRMPSIYSCNQMKNMSFKSTN